MYTYQTTLEINDAREADIEIEYEYEPLHKVYVESKSSQYYWEGGMIDITDVRVLKVYYYGIHGDLLSTLERHELNKQALERYDAEALSIVMDDVDCWGTLSDDLIEAINES